MCNGLEVYLIDILDVASRWAVICINALLPWQVGRSQGALRRWVEC